MLPKISEAEVHIWHFSLLAVPPHFQSCLSPVERQRYARLLHPEAQQQFLAAHTHLRQIIADYLERDPAQVEFAYTPWGKPWLPQCPELHFNLSHSHQRGLVALRWGSPVGVDIEWQRACSVMKVAKRWFSPREVDWLQRQDPQDQEAAFFRLWTIREAWSKCMGRGLAAWHDLDIDPEIPKLLCHPLHLIELHLPDGYHAAVVTVTPAQVVTYSPPAELRIF